MSKIVFDNFIIETAANGYLISAYMPDPDIPPMLYIAPDASRMIEIVSGFVGISKTRETENVIKIGPRK